jgi:hypothetical protein
MDTTKLPQSLQGNDRYFLTYVVGAIFAMLMLFYDKHGAWIKDTLMPSLPLYLVGTALIAQIQNMLGNRERIRKGKLPGEEVIIPRWKFLAIIGSHIVWFSALVFHVYSRA